MPNKTKNIGSKNFNGLERIVRGFSNHRRIEVLFLLKGKPELSVLDVSKELDINFKTASEHIRRLAITGLVLKRHDNREIRHRLTSRGDYVLTFLRTLE